MKIKALLSLSLCFASLFGFGFAYSDDFVRCLEANKSIPSTIIYSKKDTSFTSILNGRQTNPQPILTVTPTDESQVPTVVLCANQSSIYLKIRSGGHDYEGLSYVSDDPFVILNLFNLDSIYVDPNSKTAVVGAGALLGELYYKIWKASKTLAFPAGVCPTSGVGCHFSGGGYGNMIRKFGLSNDNMISAKIVVANGSTLTVRGGGGASFGVVLSYNISLVTVGEKVTVFRVERYQNESAASILYEYQQCTKTCEPNLFIRVLLQPVTVDKNNKTVRTTYIGMYVGSAESLLEEVGRNFEWLGLEETDCEEMSWIDSVLFWANFDKTAKPEVLLNKTWDGCVTYLKRKSDYVKEMIEVSQLEALFDKMVEIGKTGLVFNSYGGAMAEKKAWEGNLFKIQYYTAWMDGSIEADQVEYMADIRELYEYMTPLVSSYPREAYLNYRDLNIGTNNSTDNYTLGEVYGTSY